jgi:phosphoribosylformylglycinamidine cyclo-ligase
MVEKSRILDRAAVQPGDVVIAVASSGLHSNAYSLTRKALNVSAENLLVYYNELGHTLGEELLTPTRIYVKPVLELIGKMPIRSISHITGGGFFENIPRAIAPGCGAVVEKAKVITPPIFDIIAKAGNIPERDMFNTYNMGVGLCLIADPTHADEAVRQLNASGENAYIIGEIKAGIEGVELV